MASRRDFLQHGMRLSALGVLVPTLVAEAQAAPQAAPAELTPPPDLFDAQLLDLDFWVKPRTLTVTRPASGERAKLLYWKDGEVIDSAYQELCHLLRDVNGRETAPIDPKLLEMLWARKPSSPATASSSRSKSCPATAPRPRTHA